MRAIKKFFTRKSKDGKSGLGPMESVQIKSTPLGMTGGIVEQTRPSPMVAIAPATSRSNAEEASPAAAEASFTAAPMVQRSVPAVENIRASHSSDNATELHTNGSRSTSPKTPPTPSTSTRSSGDGEGLGSNKSLAVTFQNELTSTQSVGLGETTDYQATADPNQVGKQGDAYDSIPLMEQTKLPRGGISIETKAVGRIQFGIPPETIKDSMTLGIPVPQVYIVPAERFCREMGPALGVNLAEFEFPAYFNFFIYKKRCTLVVDSQEAEDNICRVFNETLLGPAQFRRKNDSVQYEEEDFAPDFPRDAIPNLEKELRYFRIMPDGRELAVDLLLDFSQFKQPSDGDCHENLGVPPNVYHQEVEDEDEMDDEELDETLVMVGDEATGENEDISAEAHDVEQPTNSKWSYKKARWFGDVATVWPPSATEEQKLERNIPRVEIFKMPSGTEYIIHDVDANNVIIGKARFSGHVKVSETMGVEGFGGHSLMGKSKRVLQSGDEMRRGKDEDDDSLNDAEILHSAILRAPPTFHPPSFGLTTLGNSHGFDKSGSVSGYVLWVNGRGIMIDPPPYSSATLEREGIRRRTIVGIILTHCHADHDAGAFQKVLTGSPVVVITTPTIYKSFIRKYAALASLSPSLLRHSHRYKPAIIGEPLRFQGATFHFTYSLHAIPCVGFRVEWRGRSMVFTGDHMNKPDEIDRLQNEGVLSKARADDLRNLPLQETDLLLHEAGAPPIHTPLEVLMKLPQRIKKRLYVVHTSSIPAEYDLRVAPTGTAGTLRLDQFQRGGPMISTSLWGDGPSRGKARMSRDAYSISLENADALQSPWSIASNEYAAISEDGRAVEPSSHSSFGRGHLASQGSKKSGYRTSLTGSGGSAVPLVSLRPASSTDAWFILNLLSAVPFMSSLSYASTMEVLETARVDAYSKHDVVVPASRRSQLLCVVWEGTCVEFDHRVVKSTKNMSKVNDAEGNETVGAVWHAGDWTGPIALQPEKRLSGESALSATHDIVAMASEGVKVITIDFTSLHQILKSGSLLYVKYLERRRQQQKRRSSWDGSQASSSTPTQKLLGEAIKTLNVVELLDLNSALRKLSAVQKRHLESLAEGPIAFGPGERLWKAGVPVDKAFLLVGGTASFVPKRKNTGSVTVGNVPPTRSKLSRLGDHSSTLKGPQESSSTLGEEIEHDSQRVIEEMDEATKSSLREEMNPVELVQFERLFSRPGDGQLVARLSKNLQKRAELMTSDAASGDLSVGSSHLSVGSSQDSESIDSDNFGDDLAGASGLGRNHRRSSLIRRRSSRARFANKVLGRLYSRRAFTGSLVFSRGHFLGDVSKMVAGLLSVNSDETDEDSTFPVYGFGEKAEGAKEPMYSDNLTDMVIHEQEGDSHILHSSTLTAGDDGCVVLVFPKDSLIPFLDEYPGLLLSLLGTQVVV